MKAAGTKTNKMVKGAIAMTKYEKKKQLKGYKSMRDLERAMGLRLDSISQWMSYHNIHDIKIALKCIKKPKKVTKHREPIEYKGKTFETKASLAKYLNIDSRKLCSYLSKHKGTNIEDAIKNLKSGMHCCTFNGKKYKNKVEMCNDLGINICAFRYYYNIKKLPIKIAVKICLGK